MLFFAQILLLHSGFSSRRRSHYKLALLVLEKCNSDASFSTCTRRFVLLHCWWMWGARPKRLVGNGGRCSRGPRQEDPRVHQQKRGGFSGGIFGNEGDVWRLRFSFGTNIAETSLLVVLLSSPTRSGIFLMPRELFQEQVGFCEFQASVVYIALNSSSRIFD